ncbi:hypothetical protein HPB50_007072 [Hyalomma asiaticum]|uniref:Uncharacterized protein n=1 Tax=Hyalomma asiaticum TaxID=266040 RepID=A0ACB7SNL6_HYAAI|nr:hypothetical protein HPB50_007072 [Hyalomma asiaticum]
MSSAPRAITNDVLVCNDGKANSSGCPVPMFAATARVIGRQLQKCYVLRPGSQCRVNMSVCRRTAVFYASLKKQEEDKLAELAEKYRDRARERREGINPDYQNEDPISSTAGYRAVAPDAKSKDEPQEEEMQFKTVMASFGLQVEWLRSSGYPETVLVATAESLLQKMKGKWRSTARQKSAIRPESHTTLTTNDIVINKLTQILSYLRQGMHNRKGKKKGKGADKPSGPSKVAPDDAIFEDAGDYVPEVNPEGKHGSRREGERDRERKRSSYFEKPSLEDERAATRSSGGHRSHDTRWSSAVDAAAAAQQREDSGRLKAKLTSKLDRDLPESYAECYPGAPENEDAVADSDDEVDYTKMDLGNKKGPIGRWDFDTQEEYSEYMSHKEALPKAAFQYGVKMADGRKTRRAAGKKDDKAKLDRELQKINQCHTGIQKSKILEFGCTSA